MRTLSVILGLAVIAAVLVALGNPGIVSVNFLNWSFDSSLTAVLLAAFMLGLMLGWLLGIFTAIRRTLTFAASKQRMDDYQEKLDQWNELKAIRSEHPVTLP